MSDPLIVFAGHAAVRVAPDRQLLLQCHPGDARSVAGAIGVTLGETMLSSETTGAWSALHLSPDDWLLVGPAGEGDAFAAAIAGAGVAASLVEVSDRNRAIDLMGPVVTEWLAGGCPLDLTTFADGACSRTLFGKASVMLWRRGATWRLSYARSFDDYVVALLRAIAQDLVSETALSA